MDNQTLDIIHCLTTPDTDRINYVCEESIDKIIFSSFFDAEKLDRHGATLGRHGVWIFIATSPTRLWAFSKTGAFTCHYFDIMPDDLKHSDWVKKLPQQNFYYTSTVYGLTKHLMSQHKDNREMRDFISFISSKLLEYYGVHNLMSVLPHHEKYMFYQQLHHDLYQENNEQENIKWRSKI